VFHFDCNLLHSKSGSGVTTSFAVSDGNQSVVTNVQLRLVSFVSNLSGSGSDESNDTSEENTQYQWPPSQRVAAHSLPNAGALEWL
jgi:hypothetical protein